jgi:glyoxylase I family protein
MRQPPYDSIGAVPITTNAIHHIRLTVTDIARSRAFYEPVFGWPVLLETPADADDVTREQLAFLFGGVIYRADNFLIGLRPVASDRFDEDRCGLDHLGLAVESRAALDAAARQLDELGIHHEGVKDIGPSYILEFRDPDNIALELVAPKS